MQVESVVAQEVGNLAQMSGGSAMGIDELLRESVAQVRSSISETQEGMGRISSEMGELGIPILEQFASRFGTL